MVAVVRSRGAFLIACFAAPLAALAILAHGWRAEPVHTPGAEPVVVAEGPPYEPAEALATLEIAEGFRIETFAAEPLVADPVDMTVDEAGRLYVVEMPGYPLDTGGTGRVVRLVDTDGDAYPDTRVAFAEGLTLPTGIMRWKAGVLVTDAPDVLYLEDSDGDGVADIREVVLTGFALSNPQHNFNNPLYGLDNGIYLANNGPIYTEAHAEQFGDFGGAVHFPGRPEGPVLGRNASGRNVRFRPDTGALEELSGASQFGHAFDPWGRHFLVSNARHQYHEVLAARYLRRNPGLPVREAVAYTSGYGNPADVFPVTIDPEHQLLTDRGVFTSAAGPTYYAGGAFPEPFDRVAFVTESVHNLVHAHRVEDDGATFAARRLYEGKEFLASTDSWFRPVNTYVGPDGALYVVDYYRKIVEHPEWMDEEAMASGHLYDGNDRGRIYRISAAGAPPADWLDAVDMGRLSAQALADVLGDANRWRRMHAQRLLVDRQATEVGPLLARMAREDDRPLARLHALWTLHGMGLLEAAVLRTALSDAHPGVRAQAVRLTEMLDEAQGAAQGAARFENDLLALTDDPDPKVRFQVLLTLGGLDSDRAAAARNHVLARDLADPWVHMAALTAHAAPDFTEISRAMRAFGDREEGRAYLRRLTALAGVSGSAEDIWEMVRFALDAPDGSDLPDDSNVPDLPSAPAVPDAPDGSDVPDAPDVSEASVGAEADRSGMPDLAADLMHGLADGLGRGHGEAVRLDAGRLLDAFYAEEDPDMRQALLRLLRHVRDADIDPARALEIAASGTEPPARRIDMLAFAALGNVGAVVPALRDLVVRSASEVGVQEAAVRVLGRASIDQGDDGGDGDEVARFLLLAYPRLSAGARHEALNALLRSDARMHLLLDAVEAGDISRSALGWNRRVRLMRDTDGAVKQRARALLRASDASRPDVLRAYEAALDLPGDAGRGQGVYFSACARCHGVGGAGVLFGPDLGTVRHWPPRALLEAILVPERSIADGYALWRLERRGAAPLTGILRAETPSSVTLVTQEGREEVTLRAAVETLRRLDESPMPPGLEEDIDVQEMADLLEFLRQ